MKTWIEENEVSFASGLFALFWALIALVFFASGEPDWGGFTLTCTVFLLGNAFEAVAKKEEWTSDTAKYYESLSRFEASGIHAIMLTIGLMFVEALFLAAIRHLLHIEIWPLFIFITVVGWATIAARQLARR